MRFRMRPVICRRTMDVGRLARFDLFDLGQTVKHGENRRSACGPIRRFSRETDDCANTGP